MNEIPIINAYEKGKYDVLIFVDCAAKKLAGEIFEGIEPKEFNSINIDHHGTNEEYAKFNLVDDTYSSTAEIILDLIKAMDVGIDKKTAEYLYTGIVTDSGQFAYSYTSERTHINAAYLISRGADFSKLHKQLFNTMPYSKLMLTKVMLQNLQMAGSGKIAVSLLTLKDFISTGSSQPESESLVNMLLAVEGVKAAVLLRQLDKDTFKASLRSADDVDISKAAKKLGGGGHKQASGATLNCGKEDAVSVVLDAIRESGEIK
jgi:phosphoesterase RecJ-like protein